MTIKTNKKKKINKKKTKKYSGGGNYLGSLLRTTNKDYNTSISSIPIIGSIAKITKQVKPNIFSLQLPQNQEFQIYYNYYTSNKIQINIGNQNKILLETQIEKEPYIIITNMKRYLVIIYDATKYRMIWIAEYKNHSKYKTILSYQLPQLLSGNMRKIIIQFIPYPDTLPQLTFPDISTSKRKKAFSQFLKYTKENNINFINNSLTDKAIFNIKYDTNKGINLFNLSTKMLKYK